MSKNANAQRYLFAVDPETSKVIARWPLPECAIAEEVLALKMEYQERIGDDFVVLDTDTRPAWRRAVDEVSNGADLGIGKSRKKE